MAEKRPLAAKTSIDTSCGAHCAEESIWHHKQLFGRTAPAPAQARRTGDGVGRLLAEAIG